MRAARATWLGATLAAPLALGALALPAAGRAQPVATDIVARETGGAASFGAAQQVQAAMDGRYAIPESQFGYRPGGGGNLFFSFDHFDLAASDTAVFQGAAADHVISRVTDGSVSQIYGRFESEIAGADHLFVNPAGVIFGPESSLDVDGSFHVSSADLVRFGEGGQAADWDTHACCTKLATSLPPSAFGFVTPVPGDIVFDDRDAVDFGAFVSVPPGETLSAVGGNVRISGRGDPVFQSVTLLAQAGAIQLAALPGSGDAAAPVLVPLELAGFEADDPGSAEVGAVTLDEAAWLLTATEDGAEVPTTGRVVVRAGRFEILPSETPLPVLIDSGGEGVGADPPPAIDVQVADRVEIAEGRLVANAFDFALDGGTAGDIRLAGRSLTLAAGEILISSAGDASPGDVALDFDTLTLEAGAGVGSRAEGSQPGGAVEVEADTLDVRGGVILASTVGTAASGDVVVTTRDSLQLESGGLIGTTTFPADPDIGLENTGAAGSVTIVSGGLVRVSGDASQTSEISARALSPTGIAGAAGSISIQAERVELRDGGLVTANSTGGDAAGDIAITTRRLEVAGTGGAGANPSAVIANSRAEGGPAGSVEILGAERVKVSDGGVVSVASSDITAGPSGNLVIETRKLEVHGGAITTQSFATSGEGGDIAIRGGPLGPDGQAPRARTVDIFEGRVSTETAFEEAGDLSITAHAIVVQKSDVVSKAGLAGGTLALDSRSLFVAGGALDATGVPGQLAALDAGRTDSLFDASSRLSVPGSLDVTRPNDALAGQLVSLPETFYAGEELLRNQCEVQSAPVGSLTVHGRDRIPAPPDEDLRILHQGGE